MPLRLLPLLSPLRRHGRCSPALTPTPIRSIASIIPTRTFSFLGLPTRAFSGVSGMAAGGQQQQREQQSVEVRGSVELTEKEERIFRRLLDVVRHFGLGTQLRVAGGWVRDKLLGKDSADIDIALDNMTGRNFCEKVNEYSEFMGEEQKGIGVIQWQPERWGRRPARIWWKRLGRRRIERLRLGRRWPGQRRRPVWRRLPGAGARVAAGVGGGGSGRQIRWLEVGPGGGNNAASAVGPATGEAAVTERPAGKGNSDGSAVVLVIGVEVVAADGVGSNPGTEKEETLSDSSAAILALVVMLCRVKSAILEFISAICSWIALSMALTELASSLETKPSISDTKLL